MVVWCARDDDGTKRVFGYAPTWGAVDKVWMGNVLLDAVSYGAAMLEPIFPRGVRKGQRVKVKLPRLEVTK